MTTTRTITIKVEDDTHLVALASILEAEAGRYMLPSGREAQMKKIRGEYQYGPTAEPKYIPEFRKLAESVAEQIREQVQ